MDKQNKSTPAATEAERILSKLHNGLITLNQARQFLGYDKLSNSLADKKFSIKK